MRCPSVPFLQPTCNDIDNVYTYLSLSVDTVSASQFRETLLKGTVYKPRRQRRGEGGCQNVHVCLQGGEGQGSVYVNKTHISFREY